MFKLLLLLPALALLAGCSESSNDLNSTAVRTTGESSNDFNSTAVRTTGESSGDPNATAVRNAWFKAMDRENPDLHDSLLLALHLSRQTGAEVFVRRLEIEGAKTPPQRYRVSAERGSSDNVVGVNFATREFLFDHYLHADGPSMQDIRTRLQNAARIRCIKRDLGIFGDQ